MKSCESEEPWYTPMLVAFLSHDVPRLLSIPQQHFARDVQTLESRLSAEGESFLTKTLPAFGKAIDLALQGNTPLATLSFRKRGRSALPAFLSALLRRVFKDDGWVRDLPCIESIRLLRQMCLWCKKIKKGYSDESLQKALVEFTEIDEALPTCMEDLLPASSHLGVARAVVESLFKNCRRDPAAIRPNHGPGAVSDAKDTVKKRSLDIAYIELERVFRPIPYFRSLRDASEDPKRVLRRVKVKAGTSKLSFVEKDSGGPRSICIEPAAYQWCQQGLKGLMYDHIEKHSIARGQINFTDQTINRALARQWSRYDTLDMSKASDRNSYVLVKSLFQGTWLWPYLDASRTWKTRLPTGKVIKLNKFAGMGSAVCFPVQSCVYYALAVAGLHLHGMPLLLACRSVYVYGDDLVVPTGHYALLEKVFSQVGLKFNADKCCIAGRFRESCGLDAYDGVDVTPVRMRETLARERTAFASVVKHSNSLIERGYGASGEALKDAALAKFSELRALRLPRSHRRDLPFLYWLDLYRPETVKYRHKDGITTATGWMFNPLRIECKPDDEAKYLRESLSLGGPVGRLIVRSGTVRRELDQKYSGYLSKKRVAVFREYSS